MVQTQFEEAGICCVFRCSNHSKFFSRFSSARKKFKFLRNVLLFALNRTSNAAVNFTCCQWRVYDKCCFLLISFDILVEQTKISSVVVERTRIFKKNKLLRKARRRWPTNSSVSLRGSGKSEMAKRVLRWFFYEKLITLKSQQTFFTSLFLRLLISGHHSYYVNDLIEKINANIYEMFV